MIIDIVADDPLSFADAFGNAFEAFLGALGISEAEAAKSLGVERATLNTYTHGVGGKRRRPPAEILFNACAALGFQFEYRGCRIVGVRHGAAIMPEEKQLHLQFTKRLDLAETGTVALGLKKPPGKVELSVSLRAVSE
jgi:transcriptional regulator with XRE-family HTH domain